MEVDVMSGVEVPGVHPFNQPALPPQGGKPPSRKVFPEFSTKAVRNIGKSDLQGIPVFNEVEFVTLRIAGDSKTEIVRKVTDKDKEDYAQEYIHWKQTKTQSITGWPVEQMPGLSTGQVAILKALNIHTVEHLSELTDGNLTSVGMGARDLRAKAQFLVKSAKDNAVGMRQAAENDQLRAQVANLQNQIVEIQSRVGIAAPVAANEPPRLAAAEGGEAPMREAPAGQAPVPSPEPVSLQRRGWPKGKPRKPAAFPTA